MTNYKPKIVLSLFVAFAAVGCLAQGNGALLPSNPIDSSRHVVVFLGDSLTAGDGVNSAEAYPSLVEQYWLKRGIPYVALNAGISGDTSANVLQRIDKFIDSSPALIVLAIGANDAFGRIPVETIKLNIAETIKKARDKRCPIILSSMCFTSQILGGEAKYTANFNALYFELGKQWKVPVLSPLLRSVWSRNELWLPDHMHPTAEGHRLIARDILHDLNSEWVCSTD